MLCPMIWFEIQNGNMDQHQNMHCTSSDKDLHMSLVWWLNVMQFQRSANAMGDVETKKNDDINDSADNKKPIILRNF